MTKEEKQILTKRNRPHWKRIAQEFQASYVGMTHERDQWRTVCLKLKRELEQDGRIVTIDHTTASVVVVMMATMTLTCGDSGQPAKSWWKTLWGEP